jgi:hypothetical protein
MHNLLIVHGVAFVAQKSAIPVRTAPKFRPLSALLPRANPLAQTAPGHPY